MYKIIMNYQSGFYLGIEDKQQKYLSYEKLKFAVYLIAEDAYMKFSKRKAQKVLLTLCKQI